MAFAVPVIAGGLSIAGGIAAKGMIVKGLMIAGGAMSVIGGLTGNQKLAKIGGIVGAVGGIGGALTGAFSGAGGAASSTATGTSAIAAGPSSIQNMLSAPVGSQAFMQGTGQAIGGIGAGTTGLGTGTSGLLASAMSSGTGMVNLANSAGPLMQPGATSPGAFSSLGDKLKGVGGFIKDHKELFDIGGKMLSGAADASAAKKLQQLQSAHDMALLDKKFDLAKQLEEEMRMLREQSITGLKPMDQVVSGNQSGAPVINWGAAPGGIIANQWQGAAA